MKIGIIGFLGMLFLSAGIAAAETTPPIKMGLWQSTETTVISGFSLPPQVAAELKRLGRSLPGQTPHTAVYESCLTEAQWQKELEMAGASRKQDCTTSNMKNSAKSLSFDITCKNSHYATAGHWDVGFPDTEHMHGVGTMRGEAAAQGAQAVSTNTTFDSHYVGASCGSVQPGTSKVLEQN